MKKFSDLKVGDKIYFTVYGTGRERTILAISHNRNNSSKIFYTKDGSIEITSEFIDNDFYKKEWSNNLVTDISNATKRNIKPNKAKLNLFDEILRKEIEKSNKTK